MAFSRFLNCLICSISLIDSDNLVTFKFRNSKFDLKDNFGKSNARRALNSYALELRNLRAFEFKSRWISEI